MLPERTFSYKPDFNECLARVYAWYEQKVLDRPPVRFSPHKIADEQYGVTCGSSKTAEARWLDVEFRVREFVESLPGRKFLGETFPVFWPDISPLAYSLFLGQKAEFDDVTVWGHPYIDDLEQLPELRVQQDNRYFQAVEAMTTAALEAAEGRFLVGYTDLYAGVDCTAALRGEERMCLDLIDNPDGIKRLIDQVFSEYPDVFRHFDRRLKERGQLSVTWMNLPSFETFNVLACDFAVNISMDHFDEFCKPVLVREAECFAENVFHMDGKGVAKNLDSILTLPNLTGIQWDQGCGLDQPILQWIPMIRKIQAAGKSVILDLRPEELDEVMKRVDPAGILLWINADPSSQTAILKKVQRW